MKYKRHFETEIDGFHGSYYPCKDNTNKAFILEKVDKIH